MKPVRVLLLSAALLGGLLAGVIWGDHRSAIDWSRSRAVCLASDDWGFAGFLPDSSAIEHQDRASLSDRNIMDVYWHSTLEDSAMTDALGAVLAGYRGRDGLPAVMQPNYILASLEYQPATDDGPAAWIEHELPSVPRGYERSGLWLVKSRLQLAGLWHPELHGRWHYDPERRKKSTEASLAVQQAAARQILPFPGAGSAWELGPWRDIRTVKEELDRSIEQFAELFGYRPRSVIAPDYRWNDEHEQLWCDRDLRVIQGQRQQLNASWMGLVGRFRKYAHRISTRLFRPDRVYLDRNCLFEPVQLPPEVDAAQIAEQEVRAAWRAGQPAVVQTHRINFVHLDDEVRQRGLRSLDRLLAGLESRRPIFLVDCEVADLQRRGTSWALRGDRIILRNATRSRRLVVVPQEAVAALLRYGGRGPSGDRSAVVALGPGEVRVLGIDSFKY